jgi:hypothetical protein
VTFSERLAELRVALKEREGTGVPSVSITCSGCGQTHAITEPNLDHPESIFPGWHLGTEQPYRDYCPDCKEVESS